MIGAIATTGDTNEVDDLCAIAGIRAAGFKTDDDFDAKPTCAGSTSSAARRSRTRRRSSSKPPTRLPRRA